MKAAVAKQPTSVAVDAGSYLFYQYESGIFDSTSCGTSLNHATLVVGYGTDADSDKEYWIMKNSWGAYWGDQGYIKILITDGAGICGIQLMPVYPETNE